MKKPRFELGQIVATPAALKLLKSANVSPYELLARHQQADWGMVCEEDAEANNEALTNGSRILSSYPISPEANVWIITEASNEQAVRLATTILLPEQY